MEQPLRTFNILTNGKNHLEKVQVVPARDGIMIPKFHVRRVLQDNIAPWIFCVLQLAEPFCVLQRPKPFCVLQSNNPFCVLNVPNLSESCKHTKLFYVWQHTKPFCVLQRLSVSCNVPNLSLLCNVPTRITSPRCDHAAKPTRATTCSNTSCLARKIDLISYTCMFRAESGFHASSTVSKI